MSEDLVQATAPDGLSPNGQLHSEPSPSAKKAWGAAENIMAELKAEPDATGVNYVAAVIYDLLRKATRPSSAHIARIAALEAALEPFGDVPSEGNEDYPDNTNVTIVVGRTTYYSILLGDLRRARSVLASAQRSGDRPVSPHDEGAA